MSKANKTRQPDERAHPAVASGAAATTRARQPTGSEAALGTQARSPPLASPPSRSGSATTSPQQRVVTTVSQRMLQYTSGGGTRAAVTNYTMGTAVVSPNGSRAYFTQSRQAVIAQASPHPSPSRARAPTPLETIDWKPGDQQSLTTDEGHSSDTRESMVTHTGRTTGRTSISEGAETSEGLPSTASAGNDAPTTLLASSAVRDAEATNKNASATESEGGSKNEHSRTADVTAGQLPDIRNKNGEDTTTNSNTVLPKQVFEEAADDRATASEQLPERQWHAVHDFPENGPTAGTNEETAANGSATIIESPTNQSVNQGNSTNGVIQTLGDSSGNEVPAQAADVTPLSTARISSTGSENSDGSAAAGEGGTETHLKDADTATKMTRLSPISVSSARTRTGNTTPSSAGSDASGTMGVRKQNAAAQKPSLSVTERTSGDTKTSYSGSRTTEITTTTKSGQVTKSLSGTKNTSTLPTAASLASTQASESTRAATTSALTKTPDPTALLANTLENTNQEYSDTNTREETSRENTTRNIDGKAESMQSIAKADNLSTKAVTLSGQKASDTAQNSYESAEEHANTASVANTTKFSPSIVSSGPKTSHAQAPSLTGSATTHATTKTAVGTKSPVATSRPTESVTNTTRFSPSTVSSGPKASDAQAPSLTGSATTHATTKTAISTKDPTATSRPTESVTNTTRFSPSTMSSAPKASDAQAPSLMGSATTHATTKTALSTKSPAATSRPTDSVVNTTMFSPSIVSSAPKTSDEHAPSLTGSETTQATTKTAVTGKSLAATSRLTESMADITTFSPSLAPSGPGKSDGETSSLSGSATTKATTKTAVTSKSPAATLIPTESVANTTRFSPSSVSAAPKASDEQTPSLTGSATTQATTKSAVTTKSPSGASRPAGSVANTTRFSPSVMSTAPKASDEKASSLTGSETTHGTTKTTGTTRSPSKSFQQTESVANTSISPSIVSSLPNKYDEETPSLTGTATTQGHVKTSEANKSPAATSLPAESVTNTTKFSPSVVSSVPKASDEQAQSLSGSATTHASTKRAVTAKSPVAATTPTESVANTTMFSPSIVSSAPKASENQAPSLNESTTTQATNKISGTTNSPTGTSKRTDSVANTAKCSTEQAPSLIGSVTTQVIAKTTDGNKYQTSRPTKSAAITATLSPSNVSSAAKMSEERAPSVTETTKTQADAKTSFVNDSSATTSRPTESVTNTANYSPSIELPEQTASKKKAPSLTGSVATQATTKTVMSIKSPAATSTAAESVASTTKFSPSVVSSAAQRTSGERAPSLTESATTHATTKTAKTSKSPTTTSRPTESAADTTVYSPSSESAARKKCVNETTSLTGSIKTQVTANVVAINRSPAATPRSPSAANVTKHSTSIVSSVIKNSGEEPRALPGSTIKQEKITTVGEYNFLLDSAQKAGLVAEAISYSSTLISVAPKNTVEGIPRLSEAHENQEVPKATDAGEVLTSVICSAEPVAQVEGISSAIKTSVETLRDAADSLKQDVAATTALQKGAAKPTSHLSGVSIAITKDEPISNLSAQKKSTPSFLGSTNGAPVGGAEKSLANLAQPSGSCAAIQSDSPAIVSSAAKICEISKHSLPEAAVSKAKEKSTGLLESSVNVTLREEFITEVVAALPNVSPENDHTSKRTNSGSTRVVQPQSLGNTHEKPSKVIEELTNSLPLVASTVIGGPKITIAASATAVAVDIHITRPGDVPNSFSTKNMSDESDKTREERAHSTAGSVFYSPCISSPDEVNCGNEYTSPKSIPSKSVSGESIQKSPVEAAATHIQQETNVSAYTFPIFENAQNVESEPATAAKFATIAATPNDGTKKQESVSGIRNPHLGSSLSAGKCDDVRMTSLQESAAAVETENIASANKSPRVAELPASAKVSNSSRLRNISPSQYMSPAEAPPESPITKLTASTVMAVTTSTNCQNPDIATCIFAETTQVTIHQQRLIDDKVISIVTEETGVQMAPASRISGVTDTVGPASHENATPSLPLMDNVGNSSIPAADEVFTSLEAHDAKEGNNGHAELSKDHLPTRVSNMLPMSSSPPVSLVDAIVPTSSLDGVRNDARTNEGTTLLEEVSHIAEPPSLLTIGKTIKTSQSPSAIESRSLPVQEASDCRPKTFSANAASLKKQRPNTSSAVSGVDQNKGGPTAHSSDFSVCDGRVVAILKAPVVMMPLKEINVTVQSSGVVVTKEEPAVAESTTSTFIHDAGASYWPNRLNSVPVQNASGSVQHTEKVLSESRVTTVIRHQDLSELTANDADAKYDAVVTSCATSVNLVQSAAVPVSKSPLSPSLTMALEMPAINFPGAAHFDHAVAQSPSAPVKLTPSVQVNTYGIAVDEHALPASQTTPSWTVTKKVSAEETKTPKHQATVAASTVYLQNIISTVQSAGTTTAERIAPAVAPILRPVDGIFSRATTTEEVLCGNMTPQSLKPVNVVSSNSQTSEIMRGPTPRSPPTIARVAAVNSRSAVDDNRLVRPRSTAMTIIGRTPVQTASEIPVLASVAHKPTELAETLATALAESMISAIVSDPSPAGLVDAITEVAMRDAPKTALQSQQSVPESRTSVIVRNPTRGAPPIKIKKTPVSTASVSVFEGTWPSISTPVVLINPSLTNAPHEVATARTTPAPTGPATHGQVISGEFDLNERPASAKASECAKASGTVSGTPMTATASIVRRDDGARHLTAASSGARAVTKNPDTFPAEQLMTSRQSTPFSTDAGPPFHSSLSYDAKRIAGLETAPRRVSDAARAAASAMQQDLLRGSLVLPESQAAILLANVALGAAEAATIALQEVALGISSDGVDHSGIGAGHGESERRRPADGSGNGGSVESRLRAQAIAADLAGLVEDMAAATAAVVASDIAAASETLSQHAVSAVARTLLHDRRRSESGVTRGSSRDSMSDRGTVIRVQGPAVVAADIDDGRRAALAETQVRLTPSASPAASALVASRPSVTKPVKSTHEARHRADARPSHSRGAVPTEQPPGTAGGVAAFQPGWNASDVPPRRVDDPAGQLFEMEQAHQQERRMSVKQPLLSMDGRADHLGPPLRIRFWTSFNPWAGRRPSQQQQPLSSQQTLRRESDGANRQNRRGSQPTAESREKVRPQSHATPRRATISRLPASSDGGVDWQCTALTAAGVAATAAATAGGAYLLASSIAGQALLPTHGDLPTALDVLETIDLGL